MNSRFYPEQYILVFTEFFHPLNKQVSELKVEMPPDNLSSLQKCNARKYISLRFIQSNHWAIRGAASKRFGAYN